MGDWEGTIDYCALNVQCGGFFLLPFHVETIRDAWSCGIPLNIEKNGWMSLDMSTATAAIVSKAVVAMTGKTYVLPIANRCKQIGFKATNLKDVGKTFPISIVSRAGALTSENITLRGLTEMAVAESELGYVNSINKGRTVGKVEVFSVNRKSCKKIHTLLPEEENPYYREYKAVGVEGNIIIKGKKKFINYTEDDLDRYVDITSTNAIAACIMALKNNQSPDVYIAHLKIARSHAEAAKSDVRATGRVTSPGSYTAQLPAGSKTYGTFN